MVDEAGAVAGEDLLDEEGAAAEEEEVLPGRRAAAVAAAPENWGALPASLLIPTVIILFLAGLMTLELVHSMWGYHSSNKATGVLVDPLTRLFGGDLPKE
jgi:hypothetical protein